MASRLPPLNSLRIFEAAARHLSFRKAAEELNITASAVSHGMQTLEEWLGVELFHREARGLRLTPAGEAYLPPVSQGLAILAKATEELPGRKATGKLVVSSAPAFANRLLLPRLPDFAERHPDIEVSLTTSRRIVDLPLEGIDVAIRFAPAKKAQASWTELAQELLVPVCAPKIKAQFANAPPEAIFAQVPLIHMTTVAADWAHWFALSGLTPPGTIGEGLHVDTVQMALEAAAEGLGLALGRLPVANVDLESGRLVPVIDTTVASSYSYWFVAAESDFQKPETKLFRKWLVSQFGNARTNGTAVQKPDSPVPAPVPDTN